MDDVAIIREFEATRNFSVEACQPLQLEDYGLQAAVFASPPKWHLAHTTWFFDTFILKPYAAQRPDVEPLFEVMFNSYYNGIGEQHPRDQRGLLSRPTLAEVLDYREQVEEAVKVLLAQDEHPERAEILARLKLGVEHERQHQELFFTDLKYSLAANPLYPTYIDGRLSCSDKVPPLTWLEFAGGLVDIGHSGADFCFDNELPRHGSYLQPFSLASRLVSNAEYQQFVDDGGYRRPELWLSDGWAAVQAEGWNAPLHWLERDGQALEFTLHGLQARDGAHPVCHVSGYEADAYARWAGARLPTEQELEVAAQQQALPPQRSLTSYHPQPAVGSTEIEQLYGACWQWTQSAYSPYPGFRAVDGAIGEYNGKFMSNQWVLRGSSCVTNASQSRSSYRNFFYPQDRWQFSGIRLAQFIDKEAATP